MSEIIVDTGPLVAMLVKTDAQHVWAVERLRELPPPFLTCEPVLAEVAHLVRRVRRGLDRFVDLLMSDLLRVELDLMGSVPPSGVSYANTPTDRCLSQMRASCAWQS